MSSTSVSKNENERTLNHKLKIFISGGIAGSFAKTLVAPIDRAKILFQVHNIHYNGVGVLQCFSRIVKNEGFLSLYKGNGAQILRIFPYAAIQFTGYETFKHFNGKIFGAQSFMTNLLSGSLAGLSAVTVTYPLDVIRSRLAFQYKGEEKYLGIIDCIRKIYKENSNIKGFYRGYSVTVCGMLPYAGLSFSVFEKLKLFILNQRLVFLSTLTHSNYSENHHKYELTVVGRLICGGLTGAIAQTLTYPIDVVRRHLQLYVMIEDLNQRKASIKHVIVYVYRKYGIIRGFYRGITLNYLRAIPMVGSSFCFYEISKKLLGLDTGILIKLS